MPFDTDVTQHLLIRVQTTCGQAAMVNREQLAALVTDDEKYRGLSFRFHPNYVVLKC